MQDTIQAGLTTFIATELLNHHADGQLEPDDDLLAGGLVDSLGIMRLIAFIEETHEISVPPGDVTIEHFRTIETVARYIEAQANS